MTSRLFALFLMLWGTFTMPLMVGCDGGGPVSTCESASDCQEAETCVDGACQQSSTNDESNPMVCESTIDCPNGMTCTGGECFGDIEPEVGEPCSVTNDCPLTQYCNSGTAQCELLLEGWCRESAQCSTDAPLCSSATTAVPGRCVECLADSDCAGGGTCVSPGTCQGGSSEPDAGPPISCPPNASPNNSGQCVCDNGYVPDGAGNCVIDTGNPEPEPEPEPAEQCPPNSSGIPPNCFCDEGFIPSADGTSCVIEGGTGNPLCNDDCLLANDGVCEDGGEGSLLTLCDYGSDCSDCGSRESSGGGDGMTICTNTCTFPSDDICDDGGPGSSFSLCDLGTDCDDCGPRTVSGGGGGQPGEGLCTETCTYSDDGDCDDGGENSDYSLCALGTDCLDCGIRYPNGMPPAEEDAGVEPPIEEDAGVEPPVIDAGQTIVDSGPTLDAGVDSGSGGSPDPMDSTDGGASIDAGGNDAGSDGGEDDTTTDSTDGGVP